MVLAYSTNAEADVYVCNEESLGFYLNIICFIRPCGVHWIVRSLI